MRPWARAALEDRRARGHRALARVRLAPRAAEVHPAPSGWRAGAVRDGAWLQSAAFDGAGELLAAATVAGALLVQSAERLLAGAGAAAPLLALQAPALSPVLAWSRARENELALVAPFDARVRIYDVERTRGAPARELDLPPGGGAAAALAFFPPGAGYSLAAGAGAAVALWDLRCAARAPTTVLASLERGAVAALALPDDAGSAALAATEAHLKAWDLRGGSGGALLFGGVPHRHALLACHDVRAALARVPGLAAEAGGVPRSALAGAAADPRDPRRVAFHLRCGWAGVLDLESGRATHVYAPAGLDAGGGGGGGGGGDDGEGLGPAPAPRAPALDPGLRVTGAWAADGRRFALPLRADGRVRLLDFAPGRHAGCAVGEEEEREEEAEERRLPRAPPAVEVAGASPVACVAAAPAGAPAPFLVAGGADWTLTPVML